MNSLVIIDVNNFYQSCRAKFNGKTDYSKLLSAIQRQSNLVATNAYMLEKTSDCSKFIAALTAIGVYVEKCESQAEIAVAIATDIARFKDKIHCVYLGSNEINTYRPIIQFAKNHGVSVYPVGFNLMCQGWELDENFLVGDLNELAKTTE